MASNEDNKDANNQTTLENTTSPVGESIDKRDNTIENKPRKSKKKKGFKLWFKGNKEIINTMINFAMVITTIIVIRIATQQNEAAIEATKIARRQYELSVKSDSISDLLTKRRFYNDSINTMKQIAVLNEQIGVFRDQFEITNRPYIALDAFNEILFYPNQPFRVKYSIVNQGNAPAIIERSKTMFFIANADAGEELVISHFKKELSKLKFSGRTNYSTVSDKPIVLNDEYPNKITTQKDYDSVISNVNTLYWGCQLIYIDIITGKKYTLILLNRMYLDRSSVNTVYLDRYPLN